jgi:hypothetical protein
LSPWTWEQQQSKIFFLFFFVILGFELRAYTLSHSPALFVKGFCFCFCFQIGSHELFAQAGFEQLSP